MDDKFENRIKIWVMMQPCQNKGVIFGWEQRTLFIKKTITDKKSPPIFQFRWLIRSWLTHFKITIKFEIHYCAISWVCSISNHIFDVNFIQIQEFSTMNTVYFPNNVVSPVQNWSNSLKWRNRFDFTNWFVFNKSYKQTNVI